MKKENDLLFTLLQAQDDSADSGKMSDQQLRDEVMTIFLAGHETTANALTWTFYLISEHPEIDERLQKEIYSIVSNKTDISFDDIQKLEYTTKVLTESMRLYPPAWALGRQAINDCKIGNYIIPSGSIILMSQYVMHRNPLYFQSLIFFILIVGLMNLRKTYQDLAIFLLVVELEVVLENHSHGWNQFSLQLS